MLSMFLELLKMTWDPKQNTRVKNRTTEIKVLCVLSSWCSTRAADLISPQNEIRVQRQSRQHAFREFTDKYHLYSHSQRQRLINTG